MATIIAVPLMRYLQLHATNRYLRWALLAALPLMVVSILGSHSRGAFLAVLAMGGFLLFRSRQKIFAIFAVATMCVVAIAFLPQKWFDRMETIAEYEQDGSAMGRINTWTMGYHLLLDRPILGGGFRVYETHQPSWDKFAPDPSERRAPHSNYFQIAGHHGFPGLLLYLAILLLSFRNGGWLISRSRKRRDLQWAADLGVMGQLSLVGYAVGGLVINFGYYDVYWAIVGILVAARVCVAKILTDKPETELTPEPDTLKPAALEPTRSFIRSRENSTRPHSYLRG